MEPASDRPAPTRILVADGHRIVRQALVAVLEREPDLEVVAQASDAMAAARFALGHKPDVALLDLLLPSAEDTIEAIPQIRQRSSGTRIVVLASDDDAATAVAAMRAGAMGYLPKDADGDEVVRALRAVRDGLTYLAPRLGALIAAMPAPATSDSAAALSPQLTEIIRLTALGHTSRAIADALCLSTRTVETYRSRISKQLGLPTRAHVVRYALTSGLIGQRDPDAVALDRA